MGAPALAGERSLLLLVSSTREMSVLLCGFLQGLEQAPDVPLVEVTAGEGGALGHCSGCRT